jgi:two-component system chemotaxis sensor kinase CheA
MLVMDDAVLPLVDASARLNGLPAPGATHAVVVRGAASRYALTVGRLVGQRELVTRPLPPGLGEGGLTGAAVLSDGQIALIADCDAITPTQEGPQ